LDSVQFMAQNRSGIGIWITTGIAIEPELVVAPNLLVTTETVKHRCPGGGRVHEPTDHQYNNFVWIVGLEPRDIRAVSAYLAGLSRRESSNFLGSVLASNTASGTVKSAASG